MQQIVWKHELWLLLCTGSIYYGKKKVAWRRRSSRQLSDQTAVTFRPNRCWYADATPTVCVVVFEVLRFPIMKNKELQQKKKRKTSGWNGLNSFSSTLPLFSSYSPPPLIPPSGRLLLPLHRKALPAPPGQITTQAATHKASVALTAGLEPTRRILPSSLVKFLSCWKKHFQHLLPFG